MPYDVADYRTMKERWLSGQHVGEAAPTMRAYIRTVKIIRRYEKVSQDQNFAWVPGLPNNGLGPNWIWVGRWVPKTEWMELPNVLSFHGEQGFDSNGVQSATIEIDNIGIEEQSGVEGIYHVMNRGFYAPYRGHQPRARPSVGTKNQWFDVLADKSSEIMVVAGYGDVTFPVFNGLINDLELTSGPDRVVITARDVGQLLTDQQCFNNAKIPHVPDPVTFADRRTSDEVVRVASSAYANGWMPGHHPMRVLDGENDTYWLSPEMNNPQPGNLPFIQISVPRGRYETFRLKPEVAGLKCYVAVRARDKGAPAGIGAHRFREGTRYQDGEWIDTGQGTVPGTNIPYTREIDRIQTGGTAYNLDQYGFVLGDDSIIRLYFTNLRPGKSKQSKKRIYRAAITEFLGVKRILQDAAHDEDWILVDDLADVVRTVLQWAGINDWEVENTGVRLNKNAVFNRGNYLMDIINAAAEQTGYVFYIKPPDSFDESPAALADKSDKYSMGTAIFRRSQAMLTQAATIDPVEEVREDKLLTGIQARFTDEPLAFNIRVRGDEKPRGQGGRALGGDRTRRLMYVYRPPWSRDPGVTDLYGRGDHAHRRLSAAPDWRNANVKKFTVHHDPKLEEQKEVEIAALMIAFRQALEAAQATIEFPAFPPLQLDHQIAVYDTGTGLSTRIWVVQRQIEFQGGDQAKFVMSVGGSLIDLPDIEVVRKELVGALRNANYHPGISRWERENFAHVYRNT